MTRSRMVRCAHFSLVVASLALATACPGSDSAGSGDTTPGTTEAVAGMTDEGLEGSAWDLARYLGPANEDVPPLPSSPSHLSFGADGQLAGSGGCNSFAGTYTLDGDRLSIAVGATTRMACEPEVMEQEEAIVRLLGGVASFRRADPDLELRDESGTVTLTYTAGISALPGTAWKVTGVNNGRGGVESSAATEALNLSFGTDGTVSAFGGCNQLTGPFETSGDDNVDIGPLASTRKTCGDEVDALEQQYSAALERATQFEVRGETLVLRDATGSTQVTASKTR